MASPIDKQKKSKGSMYVYKFGGIGSRTPEYYRTTTTTSATKKSKGWGSVLIRRSSKNNKKDNIHDHDEGVHDEKDMIKEVVVEEGTTAGKLKAPPPDGSADHQGRKSALSSLDTIKLFGRNNNNNYIEGRKSISHDQQVPQLEMKNNTSTRKDNNIIGRGKKSGPSISDPVDNMLSLSKTSDDVLLGNKYHVEGRRSVSHVENNMAYVGGAGRKSVSSVEISTLKSEIDLLQVRVLVTDMPGFMQIHAFRCARRTFDSLENFSAKHMAFNLKKEFDKVYGPAWHCIVGSSFGSFVTHSTGCFLYFSVEKMSCRSQ